MRQDALHIPLRRQPLAGDPEALDGRSLHPAVSIQLVAHRHLHVDGHQRAVFVEMDVAGRLKRILVPAEGLQEALVRGFERAEGPPLVQDDGPRADGEEHQGQENELGNETQRG